MQIIDSPTISLSDAGKKAINTMRKTNKLQMIAGWFFCIISFLLAIYVFIELFLVFGLASDIKTIFILLALLMGLGVLFIRLSNKGNKKLRRYNIYIDLIIDNQITSAKTIASAANQPFDDVIFDLNKMENIRFPDGTLGFFNNIQFNMETFELEFMR